MLADGSLADVAKRGVRMDETVNLKTSVVCPSMLSQVFCSDLCHMRLMGPFAHDVVLHLVMDGWAEHGRDGVT